MRNQHAFGSMASPALENTSNSVFGNRLFLTDRFRQFLMTGLYLTGTVHKFGVSSESAAQPMALNLPPFTITLLP